MPRNRRKCGPPRKNKWYPYKNEFEYRIHNSLAGIWDYEDKTRKVEYETKAKYNPDFTSKNVPWLLIEAKGRFMGGSKEAAKYVWVKRCHPELEIVFLFDNQNKVAYQGCRRRKDGSILTLGEWAAQNDFLSFNAKHIPPWLIDGSITKKMYYDNLNKQRAMYGMRAKRVPDGVFFEGE